MPRLFTFFMLFLVIHIQACASMVLHDEIYAGVPEVLHSEDSLPQSLKSGQCVIACYQRNDDNEIAVAGYYPTQGFYEGRVCRPDGVRSDISIKSTKYSKKCNDGTLPNCRKNQCWAGGDTGGFYREQEK